MNLIEVLFILYGIDVSVMAFFKLTFRGMYALYKVRDVVQLKNTPLFFEEGEGVSRILNIINSLFNPLENYEGLADLLKFDEAYNEYVMWEVEHGFILGEDDTFDISSKEEEDVCLSSKLEDDRETLLPPSEENTAKRVMGFKRAYKRKSDDEIRDKNIDEEIDYLLERLENAYLRKAADLGILDDAELKAKLAEKTSVKKRVKCLQKAIKKCE